MRIQVHDTLSLTIEGDETPVEFQVAFEGEPEEVHAVLAALGRRLQSTPAPTNGASRAARVNGSTGTISATPPVRIHIPSAAPERPVAAWEAPDLHAKAMKSVHRVVRAIADAGGKGLSVQEIQDKAKISAVPAYKMLKDDHPQGAYAARFLRSTRVGRTQIIDLTPEGRQLASLIRAGKVPA